MTSMLLSVYRALSVLPNRILGTVGEHSGGFPVESLSLLRCLLL